MFGNKPAPTVTLASIIRGLQYAAESASQVSEHQFESHLKNYFEPIVLDGTPAFRAKTALVEIDSKALRVPLIAMVPVNNLLIKTMEVELDIKVDATERKEIEHAANAERASFAVRLSGEECNDSIGIKIIFERQDQPEGFSRLIEEFTNKIQWS